MTNIDYAALTKALEKNEFQAQVFETGEECVKFLLETLKPEDEIGMGGSKTIEQTGLYDQLVNAGYTVHWHWRAPKENWREVKDAARQSENYICSANAISMDGKLVNMDGASNRVSAMVFGPRDVYILIGKNKICPDLEAARRRIFDVVSPKIAVMVNYNTPCKKTGKCYDCAMPDRCCRVEVIIHKKPRDVNMHILLIKEDFGF